MKFSRLLFAFCALSLPFQPLHAAEQDQPWWRPWFNRATSALESARSYTSSLWDRAKQNPGLALGVVGGATALAAAVCTWKWAEGQIKETCKETFSNIPFEFGQEGRLKPLDPNKEESILGNEAGSQISAQAKRPASAVSPVEAIPSIPVITQPISEKITSNPEISSTSSQAASAAAVPLALEPLAPNAVNDIKKSVATIFKEQYKSNMASPFLQDVKEFLASPENFASYQRLKDFINLLTENGSRFKDYINSALWGEFSNVFSHRKDLDARKNQILAIAQESIVEAINDDLYPEAFAQHVIAIYKPEEIFNQEAIDYANKQYNKMKQYDPNYSLTTESLTQFVRTFLSNKYPEQIIIQKASQIYFDQLNRQNSAFVQQIIKQITQGTLSKFVADTTAAVIPTAQSAASAATEALGAAYQQLPSAEQARRAAGTAMETAAPYVEQARTLGSRLYSGLTTWWSGQTTPPSSPIAQEKEIKATLKPKIETISVTKMRDLANALVENYYPNSPLSKTVDTILLDTTIPGNKSNQVDELLNQPIPISTFNTFFGNALTDYLIKNKDIDQESLKPRIQELAQYVRAKISQIASERWKQIKQPQITSSRHPVIPQRPMGGSNVE